MESGFVAADVIYRCVNDACGRGWPRQVAYCPYCGRRQSTEPLPVEEVAAVPAPVPRVVPTPAPVIVEAVKPAPPRAKTKVNFGTKPLQIPELHPELGDRRSAPPLRQPIRLRTWLLVLAGLAAIWYIAKPPGQRQKIDARVDADLDRRSAPPLRQPIRLRTWLLVLAGLAAIWYIAKPPGQRQKIDARVDAD